MNHTVLRGKWLWSVYQVDLEKTFNGPQNILGINSTKNNLAPRSLIAL